MALLHPDPALPVWNAINWAFEALYPNQTPHRIDFVPGVRHGSGLQSCAAYRADRHWHYITYGLTTIWLDDAGPVPPPGETGYELTLRVAAWTGTDGDPPEWPFTLLEKLARHIRDQHLALQAGDRIDLGEPITGGRDTGLTALAFTQATQPDTIDTPLGRIRLLHAVGLTWHELVTARESSTEVVLADLARTHPLLITDPYRAPVASFGRPKHARRP